MTGRGVFANKVFEPGDFIVEYQGQLLNKEPADTDDSYIFELIHNGRRMW